MNLRPYQDEAVAAVYRHLGERSDNPCVVLPTGTGKSLVLARLATDVTARWGGRVLVLAHVKELLEQNAAKIKALCPDIDIGVYSAGLGSRDTDTAVVVAGIQSVYKRAGELGRFDMIIVDEAHLIPDSGDGMYRTFLADAKTVNPRVRVVGLTATPYRLQGGLICRDDTILNHVCYEAGLKEMIVQGYLSPLKSRAGVARADLDGLHIRGGEFIASEVDAAMDQAELVSAACAEIVELTKDRNSILIFAAGVDHCRHVVDEIERLTGHECGMVTGDTPPDERAELLARFKGEPTGLLPREPLRFLANVNVLTTGFDATNTDCVVLLRPTASPGLYVQMVGRGTRLHPGKANCLVLDYGGNVLRHGPVDSIEVADKGGGKGTGEAPAKECPECQALIHLCYQLCPECGHEFPPPEKKSHDTHASGAGIISGEITDVEYEVKGVNYYVHQKRGWVEGDPLTVRVEYHVGWQQYKCEWICPEHTGFARTKFEKWWRERSNDPPPATADDVLDAVSSGALCDTIGITVRSIAGEKFDSIIDHVLGAPPPAQEDPGYTEFVAAIDGDYDDEIPF